MEIVVVALLALILAVVIAHLVIDLRRAPRTEADAHRKAYLARKKARDKRRAAIRKQAERER